MITLNPSRRKEGLKDTKPYPYALFREALEPQKSVPRAVLGTVFIATLLPALGSVALVGQGLERLTVQGFKGSRVQGFRVWGSAV